jgi:hypothetical protein
MSLSSVLVDQARVMSFTKLMTEGVAIDPAAVGPIAESSIVLGSLGWVVGDTALLDDGGTLTVDTVGAGGAILTYHLAGTGTDFSPGDVLAAEPVAPADLAATASITVVAVDDAEFNVWSPIKVEGETQMTWQQSGTWFACRIDEPEAAEADDAAHGRVRTDQHPTLIYDLEDDAGDPVVLTADSKVEVVSEELGTHTFEVVGQPTRYRKKQDLIAGQVGIKRMLTFPVIEAAA